MGKRGSGDTDSGQIIGDGLVPGNVQPVSLGDELIAVDEAVSLLRSRMADERVAYRSLETELRRLESIILDAMGTNTRGVVPNGTVYELCVEQRGGYTVAPSTRKILRRRVNDSGGSLYPTTVEQTNNSSSVQSDEPESSTPTSEDNAAVVQQQQESE